MTLSLGKTLMLAGAASAGGKAPLKLVQGCHGLDVMAAIEKGGGEARTMEGHDSA